MQLRGLDQAAYEVLVHGPVAYGRWIGTGRWVVPSSSRCPEAAHRTAGALLGLPLAVAQDRRRGAGPGAGHGAGGHPAAQPHRVGGRIRQDLRPPRRARLTRVRLRGGRHGHACSAEGQRETAHRPPPHAGLDGERDGSAEPRCRGRRGEPDRHRRRPRAPIRESGRRGHRGRGRGPGPPCPPCGRCGAERELPQRVRGRDRDNEAHLRELVSAFVGAPTGRCS